MYFFLFSILIITFSLLSCNSSPPVLGYAQASRAVQAAESEGASSSPCGSRDFYTAQRYLKMAQISISDRDMDKAASYVENARKTAELAEQKTIFCDKK